tara:strand:- start:1450 stop:1929 length:480 start_codon:yes stop_codon:yes gene_type:complete
MAQLSEVKRVEEQRFEFLLFINNNIICQRYFNIRDFNEDSLDSLELKELMDSIIGMNNAMGSLGIIPNLLQKRTLKLMLDNYNPYSLTQDDSNKNIFEKIDNFQFEIRVDKKMTVKGQFCGNVFPPKVRYAVDIKEVIPEIMSEIRDYLSLKNYTKVSV